MAKKQLELLSENLMEKFNERIAIKRLLVGNAIPTMAEKIDSVPFDNFNSDNIE